MRLRLLLIGVLAPLVLWGVLPLVSSADPQGEISSLQNRIDDKQDKLDQVNGRARVLTGDISGLTQRIDRLQGTIDTLQGRQDAIQTDLDDKRAELAATQRELRAVRARLVRLRARLEHARAVLADRLVELYKSDQPDIVSVVLDADGFADLLENGAYLQRIGEQDRQIITAVRDAKAEMESAERRLGELEGRQKRIAAEIQERRDEVARVRIEVEGRRDEIDDVRDDKQRVLRTVKSHAHEIHEDIDALEREQARIEAKIRAAQGYGTTIAPGPIRGGGRFIWPINGPLTSGFGYRVGPGITRFHQGLDIGDPEGTPIRAAGGGTVILAGYNGGYGNYTCIDHGGGVSTCYGHQSAIHVSTGQHVSQGQVIGLVGNTGYSFGAHLHFEVRVNGTPVQPLNYLG
jgi:murein DD-endopeptidase MepM/ murein hydrolase activator NlpD